MSKTVMGGGTALATKAQPAKPVEIWLADSSVPAVLKRLYEDIVPNKKFDAFEALVDSGELNPLTKAGHHPLVNAVNIVMELSDDDNKIKWFRKLFSRKPDRLLTACVQVFGSRFNNCTLSSYEGGEIQSKPLVQFLHEKYINASKLAEISPLVLAMQMNAEKGAYPLCFKLVGESYFTVEKLESYERELGNADFIAAANDRGETMLHKIVRNSSHCNSVDMLDVVSWMLQKNPQLVNQKDRLGWTPLDRHISEGMVEGKENSMLRLLVAAGAQFGRQLAPGFNLAAEVERRNMNSLEKPMPGKQAARGLTR